MKSMHRFSIKKKLILIILGISSFAIIAALTINLFDDIQNYKDDLENSAQINARLLGESCEAPLLFGYKNEVEQLLTKLSSVPYVLNAFIYDSKWELSGSFNRYEKMQAPDSTTLKGMSTHFTDANLIVVHQINSEGDYYGTVFMRVSLETMETKIRNNILTMIFMILGSIVISYLLAVYFQKLISLPISNLAEVTKRIAEHNDYSIRVEPVGNDEITALYKRFNYMFEVIQARQDERNKALKEVEDLNRDLEQKVSDRTRELENSKIVAENASKAKSELLSNISHELRTPLNIINGNAQLLKSKNNQPELDKMLSTVDTAVRQLITMVNNIIDFSSADKTNGKAVLAEFNVEILFQCLGKYFEKVIAKKGLDFNYSIDENIPALLKGDSGKLLQALMLLTDNAVKFTESGFVSLKAALLDEADNNFKVIFTVKDSGIGIDPDKLGSLFKSVSQLDGSSTRKYGGIGLGLILCDKIVTKMGGSVSVESQPGIGSSFNLLLTFGKSDRAHPEDAELENMRTKMQSQLGLSAEIDDSETAEPFVRHEQEPPKQNSAAPEKFAKQKLDELKVLLEAYDADAGNKFSEIGLIEGCENEMKELGNNIISYEFETALENVNNIIARLGNPECH